MELMPDLTGALNSFAREFATGSLTVQNGAVDPKVFVHMDRPNGEMRLTYGVADGKKVTTMVTFIQAEPVDGEPCFSVGWAVPEALQRQGRATKVFKSALAELRHGLARNGIKSFYVEAVIAAENPASQRVAEKAISAAVKTGDDAHAGVPVIQYLRKISADTAL